MLQPIQYHNKIIKYKNWPIDEEKLEEILYAALHSPSERANRDWDVVTVTKSELKEKLALANSNAFFINEAPVILTMCSKEWPRWVEDLSTAEENIYLEALNQGLTAEIIPIREEHTQGGIDSEEYVRSILNIPNDIRIHSLLPLGFSVKSNDDPDSVVLNVNKLHREGW